MSLIVDALKAAERKRAARAEDGAEERAREFLASAGARPTASVQARTIWERRPPRRLSRQLGGAAAAFAAAIVVAGTAAWMAPQAASRAADRLVSGEDALRRLTVTSEAVPFFAPGGALPSGVGSDSAAGPARPIQVVRGGAAGPPSSPAPDPALPPPARTAERAADAADTADPARAAASVADSEPLGDPLERRRLRVDLAPTSAAAEALARSALDAQRRGEHAAAARLYTEALAQGLERPELLNNLGLSYQSIGELGRARDAFRRAVSLQPGFSGAWSNLGVVAGALGEESEARVALAEAMRLDPASAAVRVNLALAYVRQGLPGEARDLLAGVLAMDSTHAEAHYALGQLLDGSGDRAEAARHYRAFLRHGGGRFPAVEPLVRQRIERLEAGRDG